MGVSIMGDLPQPEFLEVISARRRLATASQDSPPTAPYQGQVSVHLVADMPLILIGCQDHLEA
jgi:hypothetical protein